MKVLHTSDWHLGHQLYNYDRREEQEEMLRSMATIVEEQRPDVMIVSGDIFHTAQPSAVAQKMLVDGLLRIRSVAPDMPIVMTAGNHDSASKIEIHSDVWATLGVTIRGQLNREHPEHHIVEIPGKGWVVALPYFSGRNLPEGFVQGLLEIAAEKNDDALPVVLTAHVTVSGSDFTGHDDVRDITVGGIDSYPIEAFGEGYDYLALGHIHKAQTLRGTGQRARYSGTPLAVSFSECYSHSVSLVEVGRGVEPQVEEIAIGQPVPLVTIPTEGAMEWEEAFAALREFDAGEPGYIRLNVRVGDGKELPPQAHQDALQSVIGKRCRFCLINPVREETATTALRRRLTVSEFKVVDPIDLARRFGVAVGSPLDDDMTEIFNAVVASMAAGSDNAPEGE